MIIPNKHLTHGGRAFVFCPKVTRPDDRIAYWQQLGVPDPLRCKECGKYKSADAAPEWRCACK